MSLPVRSIYFRISSVAVIATSIADQKTEFVTKPIEDFESFLPEVAGFRCNRRYNGNNLYGDHFVSLQFISGN